MDEILFFRSLAERKMPLEVSVLYGNIFVMQIFCANLIVEVEYLIVTMLSLF